MKLITKLFVVALLATSFVATAQDEDGGPELSISGSVDAYFRYNLSSDDMSDNPGSSFANQNGFSLGMANIILGVEGENSGFVADLVFGPRGSDAVFGSQYDLNADEVADFEPSSVSLNQLYAYWNVSDVTTITIGNFNTFLGYEVISPTANFNYSTSFMFSNGPFSHSGLKVDIAPNDDLSFMLAVLNPTDFTDFNPVDTYTLGAQVGYKGVYLNLIYGDQDGSDTDEEQTFQIDLTAGWDLSDALYFGLNATYNTTAMATGDPANFYGAAGYLQYALSDAFSLGTRVEYFGTTGGKDILVEDAAGDASIIDVTLSANYKVGDLTIIPELRLDAASEDSFSDTNGDPTSSLSSFVLAAVYAF